ncbi:Hypothetical predicted protein [Podarcis lilfordi]|uniref:Uncharacterized protein n=1 Tax=Podarcis lilfordi TaxID=74358 RepID=A0AA35KRF0_9SAUR|nr:Hypothetical predicted protein [Podarcis lilfordi]
MPRAVQMLFPLFLQIGQDQEGSLCLDASFPSSSYASHYMLKVTPKLGCPTIILSLDMPSTYSLGRGVGTSELKCISKQRDFLSIHMSLKTKQSFSVLSL